MDIALDARTIYTDQRRGTGKNLIDLYRELSVIRPDWRVLAYHRCGEADESLLPADFCQPVRIEMPGDRVDAWSRWRLPAAAWRAGVDVLHCPANRCPAWMAVPTVVTIHDLIPLDMPAGRPPMMVRRFEQSVHRACRSAAHIITPSQYTRDRLIGEFKADPDHVTVNHWAPDQSIQQVSAESCDAVLSRYEIARPYVLHFGAPAPRKNTLRLIEAWATLDDDLRRRWRLLVVGLDQAARQRLARAVQQRGVADSVHLHQFAPEADVSPLLSAADVLAYPSLSEEFGLPILDAWATQTAVLTSNATSLPEVAGDAALLIDPVDPQAIASGLRRLMTDEVQRESLINAGRQRLSQFTWRATAQQFAQVIESVAEQRSAHRAAA